MGRRVVVVALGGGVCPSAASGNIGIPIGVIGVRPFLHGVASIYDHLSSPPMPALCPGERGHRGAEEAVTWRAVYID